MHIHFLDVYHSGASALHALDARVKLILTLAYILTLSLLPAGQWPIYILLFALILCMALVSELGVTFAAKRALLAIPFVLAALPLLFTTPGTALLSGRIGSWGWTLTAPGLTRFASIALKSWLSLQAAILLSATTAFPALLMAMRAIRIPRLLVAIIGLMWRYLFILADEAMRLLRAREARSAAFASGGGGSVAWRARVTGHMAGSLFLRGYERSERVYSAMLARGYDGEVRTLALPPLAARDRAILLFGLALLFGLMLLAFLPG